MATYFTSDTHYGHLNIIKYCDRPFAHTYAMEQALIQGWNDLIQPEDEVYFLGDFAMNKIWVPRLLPKLNGTKILICGNHDVCFKEVYGISSNLEKPKTKYYEEAGFQSVQRELLIPLGDEVVLLNHFPYQNPKAVDQRYAEMRPVDKGGWLLHGHSHSAIAYDPARHPRSIDVGVDGHNYRPWSKDELLEVIRLANS